MNEECWRRTVAYNIVANGDELTFSSLTGSFVRKELAMEKGARCVGS